MAALFASLLGTAYALPFSTADARHVVDQAIDLISKHYVFPKARAGIVAQLRAHEAAGRYDVVETGLLIERLGSDLTAAGNDKHLWIKFDPSENAALRRPSRTGGADAFYAQLGRAQNEGYEEFRVLPGNVRYVNLTGFHWNGSATANAVRDCARFLSGGDAAIIDLRRNGGGSGEAVQALVSYFLPPDHRKLMTFHEGATGAGHATYVLDALAGPRLVGKPLFILTSSDTGSAAEEFAYHVAKFKLGILVGRTTAGAANNDTLYPVADDFVLSVSTGRPEHPVTHGNWQGTGVVPDVDIASEKALGQAHLLAIKQLSARSGTEPARYDWIVAGLVGRMSPPIIDAQTLETYAGRYGIRTVTIGHGVLVVQRENNPPTSLLPLAPDLFAFENTDHVRLRFRRSTGRIVGFDLLNDDGQVIPVDRNS